MIRRLPPRGFTLLEVLLASALMVVLSAALFSAMSIGFRARASARAHLGVARQASIALELAEQDLQSVLPPRGILAGPFVGYAMGGAAPADSLDFFTLGRDAGADADDPLAEGIRRVQLVLRTDLDPPVLVRRVQRNLLAPVQEAPLEEPLVANVRAFGLRYFDGLYWRREWDSTLENNTLPMAVEMTLELEDDQASPRGGEPRVYRLTQVVPLSCGRPARIPEDLEALLLE